MQSPRGTAVIPARGGSKRIPRKNVRPFLGAPLIARTVRTVRESGVFERILVSTDDPEIAEVSTRAGAEVPFVRPGDLADDRTGTRAVIQHAIGECEAQGRGIDLVCSVYATAVLLDPNDLVAARDVLLHTGAAFVFSGTSFPFPIQRAVRILDDGTVAMFAPQYRLARSQDLEEAYHDAGQFYWGTRDAWMSDTPMFGRDSRMFVVPRWRVQDIDTPEDWTRAELMAQVIEQNGGR
jgi:pseudaminic acid cytidylyltransferase